MIALVRLLPPFGGGGRSAGAFAETTRLAVVRVRHCAEGSRWLGPHRVDSRHPKWSSRSADWDRLRGLRRGGPLDRRVRSPREAPPGPIHADREGRPARKRTISAPCVVSRRACHRRSLGVPLAGRRPGDAGAVEDGSRSRCQRGNRRLNVRLQQVAWHTIPEFDPSETSCRGAPSARMVTPGRPSFCRTNAHRTRPTRLGGTARLGMVYPEGLCSCVCVP
jgi:hypothetical protein